MLITSSFSFKKGYGQISVKDAKAIKRRIMSALNLKGDKSWYNRLNGKVEPKVSEAEKIEQIFKSYNITDIWGE